jgi:hypothetical protein
MQIEGRNEFLTRAANNATRQSQILVYEASGHLTQPYGKGYYEKLRDVAF